MRKILCLSGSLRDQSTNTRLLRGAAALAPKELALFFYEGLSLLPHFNPDLDTEPAPPTVKAFRTELKESAGVVISSPEYAHGMPGALKNALDWIVSSGEFSGKPVLMINASAGQSEFAEKQFSEVLRVMEAKLLPSVVLSGPKLRKAFGTANQIIDPEIIQILTIHLIKLRDFG